jgi:methionyl-tRNA formyltransferase
LRAAFFAYRSWAFDLYRRLPAQARNSIAQVYTTGNAEDGAPRGAKTIDPKKVDVLAPALRREKIDVVLFAGWSWMVVPKEFTDEFVCVCLHPSPLPRYRGGSPIQHQIMAGERQSAVTLFRMTQGIDDGDIFEQEEYSLDGELWEVLERISLAGAKAAGRMLSRFSKADYSARPQDASKATVFRRRTPEESEITAKDISGKSARKLHDFVRALQDPYPNAFIRCGDGKKLFITRTKVE